MMKRHAVIRAALLAALVCGAGACSRKPRTPPYENLGDGKGNPRAAPILAATEQVLCILKSGQWDELHQEMTPRTRANLPASQLAAQAEMMVERFGVPEEIAILELHLAEVPKGPEKLSPTVLIGVEGHSNILPNPVRLASPVSGHVAFVLAEAKSRDPGLKSWLTLVLHRVEGDWGLVSFHMNVCEANGHGGTWFMAEAERFESEGKHRSAFLYRGLGAELLIPSPFIMVPSASRQLERFTKGQAPPNLPFRGARPADVWEMKDGTCFAVKHVGIIGAPTFLCLEVRHESEQKEPDSPDAKQEREELFHYICERFPEYGQAFDGVFVGSETSLGKGYRDYFQFGAGEQPLSKKSLGSDRQ